MCKTKFKKLLSLLVCASMSVCVGSMPTVSAFAAPQDEVIVVEREAEEDVIENTNVVEEIVVDDVVEDVIEEDSDFTIIDDIEMPAVHAEVDSLVINENYKLTEDLVVKGDVIVNSGELNLDNHKLLVKGNVAIKGNNAGIVDLQGELIVNGNFTIAGDGDIPITGYLWAESKPIVVGGDFVINTNGKVMGYNRYAVDWEDGSLYLYGNYIDKKGSAFSGTLVMASDEMKTITMQDSSTIYSLGSLKPGVKIAAKLLNINTLYSDVLIADSTTIKSDLDLSTHTLKVEKDLIVENNISVYDSTLQVSENFIFGAGEIPIINNIVASEKSIIDVGGNFEWNSTGSLMGYWKYGAFFEAGNIYLGGNYTDKIGGTLSGTLNLTGDKQQDLIMKKESSIFELKAEKATIKAPIFNVNRLCSNVTIDGDITIYDSVVTNKNDFTVNGDVICLGSMDTAGSTVKIAGNLSYIDGTSTASGILCADVNSKIYIDGDFKWNSLGGHLMGYSSSGAHWSAGIMYLKGNYYDDYGTDFKGTLVMLSTNVTVSSSKKIDKLVLSGPKKAYSFPKGECWVEIEYQIDDIEIAIGQKYSVAYAFEDVKDIKKYVVKSEDGGKASVSKKGLLKPKKAGKITVYPVDSSKKQLADGITIVIKKPVFTEKKLIGTAVGQTISCNSIVKDIPAGSEVKWSSSKESVATIDPQTGTVTILKKGTTKIRCEIKNSYGSVKKLTITLKVKIPKA